MIQNQKNQPDVSCNLPTLLHSSSSQPSKSADETTLASCEQGLCFLTDLVGVLQPATNHKLQIPPIPAAKDIVNPQAILALHLQMNQMATRIALLVLATICPNGKTAGLTKAWQVAPGSV